MSVVNMQFSSVLQQQVRQVARAAAGGGDRAPRIRPAKPGCSSRRPAADHSPDALHARLLARMQQGGGAAPSAAAATSDFAAHRASVVDYLAAATLHLRLARDCLHTGVSLLDRFLAAQPTPLPLLQPAGVACLWIAAKFQQHVVPVAAAFAELMLVPRDDDSTDSSCSGGCGAGGNNKQLLVLLEQAILQVLDYQLVSSTETSHVFKHRIVLRLCSGGGGGGGDGGARLPAGQLEQLYCMTSYLTEVALLEHRLVRCPPSQVAAAAFAFAAVLLGVRLSDAQLRALAGHGVDELQGTMQALRALHSALSGALRCGQPCAVTIRYMGEKAAGVASVAPIDSADDPRGACIIMA